MNHTLIIFSSTKSLRIAERIKATLDHALHVTIWNQGFFDHSRLPPVWTFLKIPSYFDTFSSREIKEGSDIEKITHFLLYNRVKSDEK